MSQRQEFLSPQSDRSQSSSATASSSDDALSTAAERATNVARDTATEAKRKAENLYRATSSGAADASDAIDATADALADSGHETLSQFAASISDRVRTFSNYLENRQLEDLVDDARGLAQRNPALFVAGGVALGFTLSRFLKATGGSRRIS
jgi:phage repressor protein C with HTH and peptisase S24 domain